MFITAWPAVRWGCRPGNDESLKLYQICNFLLALKTVFIFCAIIFSPLSEDLFLMFQALLGCCW
jgi:hypothetical protein